MTFINSMIIAFAMYSKIPMPRVDWNEKNMRYSMCFFPLIGVVEGACFAGLWYLLIQAGFGTGIIAAILTVLPLVVTGGIHMDGFLDTMDALSSWQTMERRLEILKDSHTGAFAIITGTAYMILYYGGVTELHSLRQCLLIAAGFVLSRALSGMALVTMKGAKKDGLLYTFASSAHKNIVRVCLGVYIVVAAAFLLYTGGMKAAWMVVIAFLVYIYYSRMSGNKFGGLTGDLAGWFLQICELAILYTVVIVVRM